MSEMVRNRGIVKRLSTKENIAEVYQSLDIDRKWDEVNASGVPTWIENERYDIVDGCIFDVSGAPTEYDTEEEANEAVKLNETDYRVHAYFYNGGASFSEMLEESIPRADAEYNGGKEEELDKILSKHGVLTHDGWQFVTEELKADLMKWGAK